ncbi:MAG: HD domain-containing protein [Nitrospiraceae bacterium]|nr:HD domain-containing protein [Nitrospiraceae bacterium]
MHRHRHIRLSNVVLGLSSALDLVNWFVVDHHRQVTSFVDKIASEIGLGDEDRSTLAIASALHDIGAISFNEKFDLAFETRNVMKHAELGYHLLGSIRPFQRAAELVRYHHVPWNECRSETYNGNRVPLGSQILHLADRASVLIRRDVQILRQAKTVCETIRAERGRMFAPELVDAFLKLAEREYFWLDAESATTDFTIDSAMAVWNIELDMELLMDLSELFRKIIDFRSPNTATHSRDVAHLSAAISRHLGFSEREAETLRIAGNLHDLGKLAVPVDVIDKQGPLDKEELAIMRSHSYHTYRILRKIGGLDDITLAASLHHECLDGSGYPFRYTESSLPLGSRIIAVADALSALTENRSYRPAMSCGAAFSLLRAMAKDRKLDPLIVSLVEKHRSELRDVRDRADDDGMREFRRIRRETDSPENGRFHEQAVTTVT